MQSQVISFASFETSRIVKLPLSTTPGFDRFLGAYMENGDLDAATAFYVPAEVTAIKLVLDFAMLVYRKRKSPTCTLVYRKRKSTTCTMVYRKRKSTTCTFELVMRI
jgi:hypothetical protein